MYKIEYSKSNCFQTLSIRNGPRTCRPRVPPRTYLVQNFETSQAAASAQSGGDLQFLNDDQPTGSRTEVRY